MGYLSNLFKKRCPASRKRRTAASAMDRRLRFETLEERTVFAGSFDSAIGTGSSGADAAFDIATDRAGNAYHAGYFSGTVDFDPTAVHADDSDIVTTGQPAGNALTADIYVAKYAPDGSFLWVRPMIGVDANANGIARAITTDASGAVYVGGDFRGSIQFGTTTLTSAGDKDGFVAKLDTNGNVEWASRWGGADKEYIEGIAVDGTGNVLAAGYTVKANADGSQVYSNIQVEKFSSTGTNLWAKQIGNTSGGRETALGIGTDTAGNVFVTGVFTGKVDFDPGTGTRYVQGTLNDNGFVLKLTAAGNFGWVSPFVGQNSTSGTKGFDLAVDGSNNIVVGGSYRGTVDFDPGKGTHTLPSGDGGFIAKLGSAGSLVWVQQVGAGLVTVRSLALDTSGNVYVQGLFQGQVDFDPGTGTKMVMSNGGTDVFVAKFNATGTYQWVMSFGGTGFEWSEGIAVDAAGNVYVAGYYENTVDFDPDPLSTYTLTSAGMNDLFVVKLRQP